MTIERKSPIFGNVKPHKMPKHLFSGAVSINYDSAERADITRQDFTVCPRHWYIDATFQCEVCGSEFLFSATEQRFWYEKRRFYVDSLPRRCPACRQKDRRKKSLKQQYDRLIAEAISSKDALRKTAVVGILDELSSTSSGITRKMSGNRQLLLEQIGKLDSEDR